MGNRLTRETDRPGGWTVLFNDFIDSVGKITANEKLILLILFRYGDKVFPSLQTVAASSGLSKRTVQRVLSSLEEKGIIRIVHRKGNGNSLTSNEYIVNDYHEMWADDEQLTIDENKSEELKAIRLLKARGYNISKAKELPSAPTTVTEESSHSSVTDNNTVNKKNQDPKLRARNLSRNEIIKMYNLDALKVDYEDMDEHLEILERVIDILGDLLNTTKHTIRACREDKPAETVKSRIKKLEMHHIRHVIDTYYALKRPIDGTAEAYITTMLYKGRESYEDWLKEKTKEAGI